MRESPDRRNGPLDIGRELAAVYSPPSERGLLESLFAVEDEIGASLRSGLDHAVAHIRLQWWRDECGRVAKGSPTHPLTRAVLSELSSTPGEVLAGLAGFVDVSAWDLAAATFDTRRELTAYCERWAGAMMVPAAAHAAQQAREPWLAIGAAVHEVQMLANLERDARAGRLRVPLDELDRAGVKPDSLLTNPWSPQLAALVGERYRTLRLILTDSFTNLAPAAQPALRGLIVWATLAWRRSHQLEKALPGPLQPRRFEALADAWHAWRAARRAQAGKLTFPSDSR